jgi:predicted Zn-dependent protease
MSNKVVIAKPGFNALTETDPNNLVFSSDYNTLKYAILATDSLVVDFSQYYYSEVIFGGTRYYHRKVLEITHNLGYIPFFIGYLLDYPSSGSDAQLPVYNADAFNFAQVQCYADATKLYFVYYAAILGGNSGIISLPVKYRIFKNRLGL